MRLRQRRSTGTNRRAVGAVVIAGVLVAGGVTGVQFANASTTTKAADIIVVDKQKFDVSNCTALEVDGKNVLCDGKALAPLAAGQDDNAAAQASALALEAACDTFAADAAAA